MNNVERFLDTYNQESNYEKRDRRAQMIQESLQKYDNLHSPIRKTQVLVSLNPLLQIKRN